MEVPIPHSLPKDEVRRRLRENIGDLASYLPPGANVDHGWRDEDTMALAVGAMGQNIDGTITVEDARVVFRFDLPAVLGFVKPIIENAIRSNAPKLLESPKS